MAYYVKNKICPPGSTQHKTAGPYSPVLLVNYGISVVISGQVAVDLDDAEPS